MSGSNGRVAAVFGAYDSAEGSPAYELARRVGRALAELGYTVANGGYGGTMEGAARGAKEAGGATIGVTCSIWPGLANRYIDRRVQTDSMSARVAALLDLGESGYVALPGATGTLRELATAWEGLCLRTCAARPLVCVGGFWRPLVELMAAARPGCEEALSLIDGPEELAKFFPPRE
jgi:uncharacterized protein (TIGR00725 family)